MEEAGGRECEESRVKDRESWRSNEMEERCESDRGGDEGYPATFGYEKTGLRLDRRSIRPTGKQRLSLPKLQFVKLGVGEQVLFVRAFNRKILTS